MTTTIQPTLRVTIKQSKTDPFRRGIDLFLGKTTTNRFPVKAMLNYLLVRVEAPFSTSRMAAS